VAGAVSEERIPLAPLAYWEKNNSHVAMHPRTLRLMYRVLWAAHDFEKAVGDDEHYLSREVRDALAAFDFEPAK
jgi:hypothetical protein